MTDWRKWCMGPDGEPDWQQVDRWFHHHHRSSKFDAIGWALFFIWVGTAWLAEVGVGIGLLGVAVITLGMQLARRLFDLPVEGFWIIVGIGFALAGTWHLMGPDKPLAPYVLIAIGVAMLIWRVAKIG